MTLKPEQNVTHDKQERSRTACFTGHRTIPRPVIGYIRDATRRVVVDLINKGYDQFVVGGARGYDALAAEVVLELKNQFPTIILTIVLPFPDHYKRDEQNWTSEDIEQYRRLKDLASEVIVVSESYVRGVFNMRNRRMVDMSSTCVAFLINSKSGTGYTVKYAKSQGLNVIKVVSDEFL